MNFNEILSRNLIYLRKQKRLTSERVAQVINISRQAYAAYEKGTSMLSVESLKTLADFYGITMDLMASSSLIDGRQPSVCFTTLSYDHLKLNFEDLPLTIKNTNSSIIVVKLDDLNFKLFESTITYIKDHELLIEFEGNYHCAKVFYQDDGSGCFVENEKVTFFTKNKAKILVVIGMLMGKLTKEYEIDEFL